MQPETITLTELFRAADTLQSESNKLMRVHYCSEQGELSPEQATERANIILSTIEGLAASYQKL